MSCLEFLFLHELIMNPYVWELLIKWVCLSRFQVVVVSALRCGPPKCTPSVVVDCGCFFSTGEIHM